MNRLSVCLLLFTMIASCEDPGKASKGPSGEGQEGTSRSSGITVLKTEAMCELEVVPKEAARDEIFYAVLKNCNVADKKITWLINGHPESDVSGTQFKSSEVRKGDSLQAQAIMSAEAFRVLSNAIEIRNKPPEIIRIKIMPEIFRPGDNAYVEVTGADIDGDAISFSYEWNINEKLVGTEERIMVPLKRGDKLNIKVTPFDGEDHGKPAVLEEEILNMAPMIVDHNEFAFDGTTYFYQARATDPDKDILTYSIDPQLDGMDINSANGQLKWIVPQDFKGRRNVVILVNDGHGGSSKYNLTVLIQ